jgi:hypothetical protein
MSRHVWFALPAYTGTIHLGTMRSLMSEMLALADRGDRVVIFDEAGNADIRDCRAYIVAQFLASEATDLVFFDWDVVPERGSIVKLIDYPVDFVGAIYPQRKDPIDYSVQWIVERPNLIPDAETGLLEVMGIPAGCMRMSRAMLRKMVDAYPDTEFYCPAAPAEKAWALFESARIGRVKFGEDFSFCKRWRDIGGKVWIDPEIKIGHVGYKTFYGCLGDWLRDRMKTVSPQPEDDVKQGPRLIAAE